ncbi:uncharacterized protein LOC122878145 isoform X2 [Siniperca chuatsi]|uniref:uncharacterized protein LOC122878145 isoform X2 n=1 Tax=Siniperca chuatsi TaxID=119488 RepID=UPI001CE20864|nr:uncharacterized protein LOC122878145 isoform X2 [Siniperca chuatsi]
MTTNISSRWREKELLNKKKTFILISFFERCLDNIRDDSQRCFQTNFGMWKEKKTRTVKLEKHEPDTCPMIVGKVKKSVPRMRTVKPKEKIKVTTSNSKCLTTTCETSGNIMRLCVNLMPVLAAAKEPVEEEEGEEEYSSTSKKEPENSSRNDPSVSKSVEQTLYPSDSYTGLNLVTDTKLSPRFVLPPITKPKAAAECCDRQKTKRCHTPLPPISLSEQTRTISSNFSIKGCRGDGLVTGQVPDSRPWIDNPLFSNSRSAEFRLPEISLSSLEALLQTVTQKLGRKRRSGDEGPWRRVRSDHLLTAVSEQRLREKSVGQQIGRCTDNRNPAHIEAATETSASGRSMNRQRSLPPLILTMTKKTS